MSHEDECLPGGILGIRMLECRGAYNQINQSKTYIWLKLNNNNAAKILQSAKINQSILLGHLKSINNLCNPANNMFMLWWKISDIKGLYNTSEYQGNVIFTNLGTKAKKLSDYYNGLLNGVGCKLPRNKLPNEFFPHLN